MLLINKIIHVLKIGIIKLLSKQGWILKESNLCEAEIKSGNLSNLSPESSSTMISP